MANITQDDEWMMEAGIVARMYMTPRQIRAYRSGRWVEGIHYKKHSPNPLSTEGRATLLYNLDWPPESPDNQYHLNK